MNISENSAYWNADTFADDQSSQIKIIAYDPENSSQLLNKYADDQKQESFKLIIPNNYSFKILLPSGEKLKIDGTSRN